MAFCQGTDAVDGKKNDSNGRVELVTGSEPGIVSIKSAVDTEQVDQ